MSGHDPSNPSIVVRRTFIECVDSEGKEEHLPRRKTDPGVPNLSGYSSQALQPLGPPRTDEEEDDDEDSDESDNEPEASQSSENQQRESTRQEHPSPVPEDAAGPAADDRISDGLGEQAQTGSPKPQGRLVLKRTFLEVVDEKMDRNRSVSVPDVRGDFEQDAGPSFTEQLLERVRTMSVDANSSDASAINKSSEPASASSSSKPPREFIEPGAIAKASVSFGHQDDSVDQSHGAARSRGASLQDSISSETSMTACHQDDFAEGALSPKTTVMLRNLPQTCTRSMLIELLDTEGFSSKYDFVYLPIDFGSRSGFGYAFINLIDVASAKQFWEHFTGFTRWPTPCEKVADVTWSVSHQGFEQHVDRYRNSPVMHESMPDECKPIVLMHGVRTAFPLPTKALRPPRIRPSKTRGGTGARGSKEDDAFDPREV